MELVHSAFFYIIAFVSVLGALGVVFMPRIIYSTVSLVVTFLSIAGLFILLNADFIGLAQIMIYGVGITIIIIFAIMLTGKDDDKKLYIAYKPRTLMAIVFSGFIFSLLVFSFTNFFGLIPTSLSPFRYIYRPNMLTIFYEKAGTAEVIGESLLKKYVLPFEILSILLLAVIVGTVVLANRDKSKMYNPTTMLQEPIKPEPKDSEEEE